MSNKSPRIEEFPWGRVEWLADHASHPGAKTSLAKMIVKPGAETPLHRHDNCSEVIHILEGSVELQVSTHAPSSLKAGETYLFPAYTPHSLRNVGDGEAVVMLSLSNANRSYKAIAA